MCRSGYRGITARRRAVADCAVAPGLLPEATRDRPQATPTKGDAVTPQNDREAMCVPPAPPTGPTPCADPAKPRAVSLVDFRLHASFLLVLIVLLVLLATLILTRRGELPAPPWPTDLPAWWPMAVPGTVTVVVIVMKLCHGSYFRFLRTQAV